MPDLTTRTDDHGVQVIDLEPGTVAIPGDKLTADSVRRRMTLVDGLEEVIVVGEHKHSSLDHVIAYDVRIDDEEYMVYNEPYATVITDVAATLDAQES